MLELVEATELEPGDEIVVGNSLYPIVGVGVKRRPIRADQVEVQTTYRWDGKTHLRSFRFGVDEQVWRQKAAS